MQDDNEWKKKQPNETGRVERTFSEHKNGCNEELTLKC